MTAAVERQDEEPVFPKQDAPDTQRNRHDAEDQLSHRVKMPVE